MTIEIESALGTEAPTSIPSQGMYGIVTPVRDEENYIGAMIDSIAAQTVPPAEWVIVDDGSGDQTAQIVEAYARTHTYIHLLKLPRRISRLPGGESAAVAGFKHLKLLGYDYIARYDADLIFSHDYMKRLLRELAGNPRLGIAGGGLYIERDGRLVIEHHSETHVRGALKLYRRECLEAIGGVTSEIGWDTLDEVTAWTLGWETRTFENIMAIHRRPTGDAIPAARLYRERGRAEYLTWSDPLFVLAKALKIGVSERSPIKPAYYLAGFLGSCRRREHRVGGRAVAKARRAQQWNQIVEAFAHPGRVILNRTSHSALPSDFSTPAGGGQSKPLEGSRHFPAAH